MPRSTTTFLAFLALAPAALAQYSQQQKLVATDGHTYDYFGNAVAISGDTLVSGALYDDSAAGTDTGSAYVFQANGTNWTRRAKLVASDPHLDDQFGNAVALWADTAVVGAQFVDTNGTQAGAVYVFTRSGTTWTLQQKLVASDGAQSDWFGVAVALDGDRLIVSAPAKDLPANDAGAAYVFVRSGTTWTQVQRLTAPDFATNDHFGYSVALSGAMAAIGSPNDDDAGSNSGSVYVFTTTGSTWSLQQKLVASTGATGDSFGITTALSGDRLLVGAPNAIVGPVRRGTAYVFERRDGLWSEAQQLNSTDPLFDGGAFGGAVAISGDRMLIGDIQDEPHGQGSGAAFVFAAGEPGIASCFGVGCPCANDDPMAGCANTTGVGGLLGGSGSPSANSDDLVLLATQLPVNRVALFVVCGSTSPVPMGNGLQCTPSPLLYRASAQSTGANGAATLDHPVGNSGGFIHPGDTRYFQVRYRDGALATCAATGNWTNVYGVMFTP